MLAQCTRTNNKLRNNSALPAPAHIARDRLLRAGCPQRRRFRFALPTTNADATRWCKPPATQLATSCCGKAFRQLLFALLSPSITHLVNLFAHSLRSSLSATLALSFQAALNERPCNPPQCVRATWCT